jgi:hypothetical protein
MFFRKNSRENSVCKCDAVFWYQCFVSIGKNCYQRGVCGHVELFSTDVGSVVALTEKEKH